MRDIYLGDSYDLVKRFWAESLEQIGKLFAHPRFVTAPIRVRYTAIMTIPLYEFDNPPEGGFGLLFDPHTGIPLPDESRGEASASHAPLPFIIAESKRLKPKYMICFDQSYHRRHELTTQKQLERKREFLQTSGIFSFYYDSHAPFLFMSDQEQSLNSIKDHLVSLGMPREKFTIRNRLRTRRSK